METACTLADCVGGGACLLVRGGYSVLVIQEAMYGTTRVPRNWRLPKPFSVWYKLSRKRRRANWHVASYDGLFASFTTSERVSKCRKRLMLYRC